MPASRQVVTRSPKRNVGLLNCPWFQDTPIAHESRLEKHFVLRSMLFPGIRHIQHQPFTLELTRSGSRYTPDFLLSFRSGERWVIEVKRSERIKGQIERFDEIARQLADNALTFFVVHQGQIEHAQLAQRAALIRRYAMHRCVPDLIAQVQSHLVKRPQGQTIGDLRKKFSIGHEEILMLIARRHIFINPHLLVHDDGNVFAVTQENSNAAAQFGSWFGCAPWRAAAGIRQSAPGQQDAFDGSEDSNDPSDEHQDFLLRALEKKDPASTRR